MDKQIVKSEIDFTRLLYENNNISIYEIDAIVIGNNRHNMSIDRECIKKSISSFANMPLYCIINNKYNPLDSKYNDFLEHFREEYPNIISRDRILPFGVIPESAVEKAEIVDRDGKQYLRLHAVVWKRLLPHVSDILKRRDGDVKVSVEFTIDEGEQLPNGTLKINKFTITCIVALGEKFTEAMEGAQMKIIRFSLDNYINECKENYSYFSNQKIFDVPKNVVDNMKSGIILREKYGRGGTKQIYNNIKQICFSNKIYEYQLNDIFSFMSTYDGDGLSKTATKYILYNMYGGDIGKEWITEVCNSINADAIKNKEGGGKLEKITINNTKEAAVKSESWENPGKSLYEPLLEAEDSKALLKEAYLIVEDGYEDAPSEHLKYPHHVVKGGELVVDVKGVQAAHQRASQSGVFSGEIKAHLEKHYKELGLDLEKFSTEEDPKEKPDEKDDEIKKPDGTKEEDTKKFSEEEFESMKAKCAEFETKFSDMEKKFSEKEQELASVNEKLAQYVKKENSETNKKTIEEFAHCLDEESKSSLMAKVEDMDPEEMKAAVKEEVMKFVKKPENLSRFSINPFMDAHIEQDVQKTDPMSKIIKKYKTKVI